MSNRLRSDALARLRGSGPQAGDRPNFQLARRRFLKTSALTAAALAASFDGLAGCATIAGRAARRAPDYGAIGPVDDDATGLPLLMLPAGFRYLSFGWTGDVMSDGIVTPGAHDGMAAVATRGTTVVLVRNHELKRGPAFTPPALTYDENAAGGTTNLLFDTRAGAFAGHWASLGGTLRNCAGGPTPWGSWISCEETGDEGHGWCFDVPGFGTATPSPLYDMGRFWHEAAAVDPATGIIYETEDAEDGLFYRFVPNRRNQPAAGGTLEALKVAGADNADLGASFANGTRWPVEWVPIDDPRAERSDCRLQGASLGAARFIRGEGCWYGNRAIYVCSTSGGAAREGQIFHYDPRSQVLTLIFESPHRSVMDNPDNIAVTPSGNLVACADGSVPIRLWGLTLDGSATVFTFAENNVVLDGEVNGIRGDFRGSEFAGVTFADGWMFVNVQSPGVTFAITGPWDSGAI